MPNANYISGINPQVLIWARNKSGYSLDEVARAFNKEVEYITGWETGEIDLTYSQLEKLAYQLYKRPIAIFFFPEPPKEEDPKQSFRTLPDFEIENLSHDTRLAIREARVMQWSLKELYDGTNKSEQIIFRDNLVGKSDDPVKITTAIREYLDIPLEEQLKWKSRDDALKKWRDTIQDKGVFIFKRPMQQSVSGFCLVDDEFPIIYLNSSTTVGRQIFTVFHELAHILLRTSGVTKKDDQFIDTLIGEAKDVEVFCNRFAAEFLVPTKDFQKRLNSGQDIEELANSLADAYNVSRHVILRKCMDIGLIDRDTYMHFTDKWQKEFQKYRSERAGGGSYYYNHATFLGDKYVRVAFDRYRSGRCTIDQLADYLNVKVKNIGSFEQALAGRI